MSYIEIISPMAYVEYYYSLTDTCYTIYLCNQKIHVYRVHLHIKECNFWCFESSFEICRNANKSATFRNKVPFISQTTLTTLCQFVYYLNLKSNRDKISSHAFHRWWDFTAQLLPTQPATPKFDLVIRGI